MCEKLQRGKRRLKSTEKGQNLDYGDGFKGQNFPTLIYKILTI